MTMHGFPGAPKIEEMRTHNDKTQRHSGNNRHIKNICTEGAPLKQRYIATFDCVFAQQIITDKNRILPVVDATFNK